MSSQSSKSDEATLKLPEGIQAWAINRMIEKLAEVGYVHFSASDLFIEESRIRDHLRSLVTKNQIKPIEGTSASKFKLITPDGQINVPARLKR